MIKSLFRGSRKAASIVILDDMVRPWVVQQEQWRLEDAKPSGLSSPAPQNPGAKISVEKNLSTVINKVKKVAKKLIHPKLRKTPEPSESKLRDGRLAQFVVVAESSGEVLVKGTEKAESSETAAEDIPDELNNQELLGENNVVGITNQHVSKKSVKTPDVSSTVLARCKVEKFVKKVLCTKKTNASNLERGHPAQLAIATESTGESPVKGTEKAESSETAADNDKDTSDGLNNQELLGENNVIGITNQHLSRKSVKSPDVSSTVLAKCKVEKFVKKVLRTKKTNASKLERCDRAQLVIAAESSGESLGTEKAESSETAADNDEDIPDELNSKELLGENNVVRITKRHLSKKPAKLPDDSSIVLAKCKVEKFVKKVLRTKKTNASNLERGDRAQLVNAAESSGETLVKSTEKAESSETAADNDEDIPDKLNSKELLGENNVVGITKRHLSKKPANFRDDSSIVLARCKAEKFVKKVLRTKKTNASKVERGDRAQLVIAAESSGESLVKGTEKAESSETAADNDEDIPDELNSKELLGENNVVRITKRHLSKKPAKLPDDSSIVLARCKAEKFVKKVLRTKKTNASKVERGDRAQLVIAAESSGESLVKSTEKAESSETAADNDEDIPDKLKSKELLGENNVVGITNQHLPKKPAKLPDDSSIVLARCKVEKSAKKVLKTNASKVERGHPAQLEIAAESAEELLTKSVEEAESAETAIGHANNGESFVPSDINEEEMLGDKEVVRVLNHRLSKKQAAKEEADEFAMIPDSPIDVLRGPLGGHLSTLEKTEILGFSAIYYVGQGRWNTRATHTDPKNNFGYDNEAGEYVVVMGDHLAYRYEIIGTLGKGSFGQVMKCRDHATGHTVAIKVTRNNRVLDSKDYNEIRALQHIQKYGLEGKEKVVTLKTHFKFRGHLFIVFELLDMNLYELIAVNEFKGFTLNFIRRFARQILSSLTLLRRHRIIHGDLKPENILLCHPAKSAVKLADFGSSTFDNNKVYTYIQTRYYRAPEVILGASYHSAIDMWSLGCILAELYTGFPIFSGESGQEQLACIMEVLGLPDKSLVKRSRRRRHFFGPSGAPRHMINSKGRRRFPGTRDLRDVLNCDDEYFVDFVAKCLVWDPDRRLDPIKAMDHPFMIVGRDSIPTNSVAGRNSRWFRFNLT